MQGAKENFKKERKKQNPSIKILREIKEDTACKNKMLLKQGQENKKEFLEIQNTRSEIKFNSHQKRKFRTLLERRTHTLTKRNKTERGNIRKPR